MSNCGSPPSFAVPGSKNSIGTRTPFIFADITMSRPSLRVPLRLLLGASLSASALFTTPAPLVAQRADSARAKKQDASKNDDKGAKKKAKSADSTATADAKEKKPYKLPPLFASEQPLAVTLTMNIKAVRKDRGAEAPYHAATMSYTDSAGTVVSVPMRARTRGIWRLKNCDFPPLRLKVSDKATKNSIFHNLGEPKLVNFCRNNDVYEQYVLQEFMLYRIYQLLTPVSHHVRLLKVTYTDSATGKVEATRYGFISEDPAQVAERMDGTILKEKGADADDLDPAHSSVAFLFQYLIGNTDFSLGGLHNAELVRTSTGNIIPIAYDFDYAGAVNASYATPDPRLRIKSVRERQFRGYCAFNAEYPKALPLFTGKKGAIYALYTDALGQLLSPRTVKETLAYFDDFYKDSQTPKDAQRKIFDDCVKSN